MDDKKTGSFYTPEKVVRFMVRFLRGQGQSFQRTLEPAAGDGRFLPVLLQQQQCQIDAVELFEDKVSDMRSRIAAPGLRYFTTDFLDYAEICAERYDLIIGNPPYISLKNMETEAVEKGRRLFAAEKIHKSVMQNLWSAFLVAAVKLLKRDGTIFFVLPAEFLQVHFAEKLRLYLEERFNNIKIFNFETNIFPEIEQHTCLVYLSNCEAAPPYIDYYLYASPEERAPVRRSRIEKNKPLKKWSNAVLDDGDIRLLRECTAGCLQVGQLGPCAPGIVTGGNRYFIVNRSFVEENQAQDFVLPILQKNALIKEDTLLFNSELFQKLRERDAPVYLLNLAHAERIPEGVLSYLNRVGEESSSGIKLKERHKCSNRSPWYGVPIVNYGDLFFFKRTDKLPHLYINQLKIHTTDAGYHIRLQNQYDAASVAFCFYNSLTLALCEFNGRYYGGGVLELTPSEFKSLFLPYEQIAPEDVEVLDGMFREKRPAEEIVSFVNERTLADRFPPFVVERLNVIRETLMRRRLGR